MSDPELVMVIADMMKMFWDKYEKYFESVLFN
jgi:hypothetical protein